MTRIGRLTTSRDFQRVAAAGRRAASGTVSISIAPGSDAATRLGFAASTRIGSAVKRNRAKRLLRESVRSLELPAGIDVVLAARPSIDGKGFATVRSDVVAALSRLGIAC